VRETLALAAAAAALAGCGAEPEARDASAPAPSSAPPAVQPWSLEGQALVRREGGALVFRLVCVGGELQAELPGVARISSEDRLTLGAGDQLAVLVVPMTGSDVGIRASGAREDAFIAALAHGAPIGASYGAQQLAFGTPAAEPRAQFLASCAAKSANR